MYTLNTQLHNAIVSKSTEQKFLSCLQGPNSPVILKMDILKKEKLA